MVFFLEKGGPNFLNFIQYYIDYFNNNSYQHEKSEYSKTNHESRSKELNELRSENGFLKQQLEKYEYKFREIASNKKNSHNEVSAYKKRDEENQNVLNFFFYLFINFTYL